MTYKRVKIFNQKSVWILLICLASPNLREFTTWEIGNISPSSKIPALAPIVTDSKKIIADLVSYLSVGDYERDRLVQEIWNHTVLKSGGRNKIAKQNGDFFIHVDSNLYGVPQYKYKEVFSHELIHWFLLKAKLKITKWDTANAQEILPMAIAILYMLRGVGDEYDLANRLFDTIGTEKPFIFGEVLYQKYRGLNERVIREIKNFCDEQFYDENSDRFSFKIDDSHRSGQAETLRVWQATFGLVLSGFYHAQARADYQNAIRLILNELQREGSLLAVDTKEIAEGAGGEVFPVIAPTRVDQLLAESI